MQKKLIIIAILIGLAVLIVCQTEAGKELYMNWTSNGQSEAVMDDDMMDDDMMEDK